MIKYVCGYNKEENMQFWGFDLSFDLNDLDIEDLGAMGVGMSYVMFGNDQLAYMA